MIYRHGVCLVDVGATLPRIWRLQAGRELLSPRPNRRPTALLELGRSGGVETFWARGKNIPQVKLFAMTLWCVVATETR